MFSRRYFCVALLALVLWVTVSIADSERGELGEPSGASKVSTAMSYANLKYKSRQLGEIKPFTDGKLLQHSEEDKVMSPRENLSKKIQRYQKKFGEDKNIRASKGRRDKAGHYGANKEMGRNLAKELHYWKEKAISYLNLMKIKTGENNSRKLMDNRKESEYKTYLAIVVALVIPVVVAVFYVCQNNDLKKSLKETIAEGKILQEELSERDMFHNISETNYQPFEIQ